MQTLSNLGTGILRNPGRKYILRTLSNLGKGILRYPKYVIRSAPIRSPKIVECSVCSWRGKQLADNLWHKMCECPRCHSDVRHRILMSALSQIPSLSFEKIIGGKKILHFAPEWHIEKRLRKQARQYLSADLHNPRRDLQIDITKMTSIPAGAFDLVIACDVLEHVDDDHRAIQEIFRILSPGGYAILTVPQQDNLAETFEDPTVVDPDERQRLFGQWDHVRIYGDDFTNRLEAADFDVTMISSSDFSDGLVRKHILFPPVMSDQPLATNFRKVFFARKPKNTAQKSLRSAA